MTLGRAPLVVLSYPGPDRSVKLEQLRAGRAVSRRYRNRRIGEFLKELDLTEGRSTGIPKIIRAMQENGSPPPEFEFDEDHSYFLVRLPVHPAIAQKEAESQRKKRSESRPESRPESGPESGVESGVESDITRLILVALGSGILGKKELAFRLGKSKPTRYLNDLVRKMLRVGLIEYTIPNKPKSRLQKYRLTPKGQNKLASVQKKGARG